MKRNIDDLGAVAREIFYVFVGKTFDIVNPNIDSPASPLVGYACRRAARLPGIETR